jgi:hypothetical protein
VLPDLVSLTGVSAAATDCDFNVLTVYGQMLDWALPVRLAGAGL